MHANCRPNLRDVTRKTGGPFGVRILQPPRPGATAVHARPPAGALTLYARLARLPHATSRLTRAKTAPVGRLVRAGHRVTSAVSPLASVAAAVA